MIKSSLTTKALRAAATECKFSDKGVAAGARQQETGRILVLSIYLLLCFKPMSLFYLEKLYPALGAIDAVWSVVVIVFSFVVIVSIWWHDPPGSSVLLFTFCCSAMVLSVFINNGTVSALGTVGESLNTIGLLWLLDYAFKRWRQALLNALVFVFGTYMVLSWGSVFMTGHVGLVPGTITPVYFYGQKNMIFIYGIPLLVSMILRQSRGDSRVSTASVVYAFICAVTSLYTDSVSSLICFSLLGVALLSLKIKGRAIRLADPYLFLGIIVALFAVTVILQNNAGFIEKILLSFDRSVTFSGRTPAWNQAMDYFSSSIVYGCGNNLVYVLAHGVEVSSAHSFYLASLAKYGLLFTIPILIDIFIVSHVARRARGSVVVCACTLVYFLLLAHSLYDIMYLNIYILIRACLLETVRNSRVKEGDKIDSTARFNRKGVSRLCSQVSEAGSSH